ncbi:MAG: family hydrolase [Clostridiales bacterium]|jgi:HAD superfamily hydrolase (TIGR01509 family)|nr:family hydrolase [Clostridiales bacterium]
MLKNIEGVIFDLDGTLIDSMWLWEEVDHDYLEKFGIEIPEDLKDEIEGMSATETANYFKNRFNIKDSVEEIMSTWIEMSRDYYLNRVPLKNGVIEFLEYLYKSNIKIGIGTSNFRELTEAILNKYEISHYFSGIATSCEALQGKPAPDVFLLAANRIGVHPNKCLVFEDIPNGIRAAKAAKMKCCAVYDNFSKDIIEEKKALADYYINDYTELMLV